jgi:REP-associated tyrosine transposase
LQNGSNQRDAKWTKSIAVGDKEFVMETKAKLGAKAMGRKMLENNEGYELRESQSSYNHVFAPEKCSLRLKNDHLWQFSS